MRGNEEKQRQRMGGHAAELCYVQRQISIWSLATAATTRVWHQPCPAAPGTPAGRQQLSLTTEAVLRTSTFSHPTGQETRSYGAAQMEGHTPKSTLPPLWGPSPSLRLLDPLKDTLAGQASQAPQKPWSISRDVFLSFSRHGLTSLGLASNSLCHQG